MSTALSRLVCRFALSAAMLACVPAAFAQVFPFGTLLRATATYDSLREKIFVTGMIPSTGEIAVYELKYTPRSSSAVLPMVVGGGVNVVLGLGGYEFKPETSFTPVLITAAAPTPRAAQSEYSVPISNDADAHDISCDERYAVVVGANSATPVSLVDRVQRTEVSKLTIPGRLARAVSVGDDGRTVLVVLDDAINNTTSSVRRVTLEANGTLTDSGQELSFGADYVTKVRIAPGSKAGVALVGIPTRIVAFTLPGLAIRGSVNLTGGTGNALAFNPAGDKVYARSGRRAIAPDVIEGFAFDPATGSIGQTASPRIANVSGFTGVVYLDPMAISTDGTRIVAAEENAAGELPAARIAFFDATTGALVDTLTGPGITTPQTVSTLRACSVAPPTSAAIEYYHAAFDHYFVTAIADEIAKLDNGTFAGWARTGRQFKVYGTTAAGLSPVCRFFSTAFGAKSSHFYAALAAECAIVKANPNWLYEGDVFFVALPAGDGACAAGTIPAYRLYNNGQGGAPNHRFTTDLAVRAEMLAKGWIAEGNGIGVTMCVPQ